MDIDIFYDLCLYCVLWARLETGLYQIVQFKYQYSPTEGIGISYKTKILKKCMKLYKLEFPEGWVRIFS